MTRTAAELLTISPVAYAVEQNALRNAQAKAEGWQMWTTMPEDPEWYAAMGYETAYAYVLSCAQSSLSDAFKEINGWRPRGIYPWADMSLEAIEAEIARLYDGRDAERAADAKALADAMNPTPLTHNPFAALLGK